MHVSTDDVKAELMNKKMKETNETRDQAFKSIEKEANEEYSKRVI